MPHPGTGLEQPPAPNPHLYTRTHKFLLAFPVPIQVKRRGLWAGTWDLVPLLLCDLGQVNPLSDLEMGLNFPI